MAVPWCSPLQRDVDPAVLRHVSHRVHSCIKCLCWGTRARSGTVANGSAAGCCCHANFEFRKRFRNVLGRAVLCASPAKAGNFVAARAVAATLIGHCVHAGAPATPDLVSVAVGAPTVREHRRHLHDLLGQAGTPAIPTVPAADSCRSGCHRDPTAGFRSRRISH